MSTQARLTFSAREVFYDIRSYLAGRFVGSTRDEFFLNEVVKMLFCKYEFARNPELLQADEITRSYRSCFRIIVNRYPDIFDADDEIELDAESIRYIDEKLSVLDLGNMERDVMGDAYELFMGSAVKGQFGQFFTPKNAADLLVSFINPEPEETVLDLACGAGGFLASAASHVRKHHPETDMTKYTAVNLYGVDKDDFLSRLCRIRLASIYQNTGHISCADSLVWDESALGSETGRFDVILTNPPFGSNISAGSEETLGKFVLAHKYRCRGDQYIDTSAINLSIPPQVVFFEQCLRLLKPEGRLGIVVPESMISSRKYGYVSNYLLENTMVKAIVGMPENLFKTSGKGGTHTKTCLVYLEKKQPKSRYQRFFVAEAKWCGHDSRGRSIPNDDLPQIHDNYALYRMGNLSKETELGCTADLSGYDGSILAPRSFTSTIGVSLESKSAEYDFYKLGQLIDSGAVQVSTGDEVGKLEYGTGDVPFIRTSDIANWRVSSDSKHKISEKTYQALRQKQDVQVGDILMVKDGGYLIGTCAMITELDTRIVYQSHIYKFRVMSNEIGLTPQYLLAALSSNYTSAQVEAKTCTLDIINSLGNRYRDIIIPIPKDKQKLRQITDDVSLAIAKDVESRKLASRALQMAELLPAV
jgi:type I restriction enzyme M protein